MKRQTHIHRDNDERPRRSPFRQREEQGETRDRRRVTSGERRVTSDEPRGQRRTERPETRSPRREVREDTRGRRYGAREERGETRDRRRVTSDQRRTERPETRSPRREVREDTRGRRYGAREERGEIRDRRRVTGDERRVTRDEPRIQRRTIKPVTEPARSRAKGRPSSSRPSVERTERKVAKNTDDVRLNKFIANSGICSRREADEYISAGLVTVNGQVVTEMGVKVKPTDDIRFNGERMKGEQKVYIVMNKPKDYVTTMGDPYAEDTVMDLIGDKCPQRVYPIGRLDKNTTGVLLFTNDGEMAEQLTHPSHNKKKVYHIFLDKNLKSTDFQQLLSGVKLEDGMAQADSLSYVDGDHAQVGLEIHSGRNRIVRRMFEALSYKVKKLDRVYFAGITKKNLKRGQWRFLTESEVTMLKMGAYE